MPRACHRAGPERLPDRRPARWSPVVGGRSYGVRVSEPVTDQVPASAQLPGVGVPEAAAARHADLAKAITDAQFRYYVLDAPTMTDGEFDALLRELGGL